MIIIDKSKTYPWTPKDTNACYGDAVGLRLRCLWMCQSGGDEKTDSLMTRNESITDSQSCLRGLKQKHANFSQGLASAFMYSQGTHHHTRTQKSIHIRYRRTVLTKFGAEAVQVELDAGTLCRSWDHALK